MSMPPFPPSKPFPESQRDSLGDGAPDFPGSSGGREQGKFRPSTTPKLTTVAVVGDDGEPIGSAGLNIEEETLLELKAIRIGLQLMLAELNSRAFGSIDLRELAIGE